MDLFTTEQQIKNLCGKKISELILKEKLRLCQLAGIDPAKESEDHWTGETSEEKGQIIQKKKCLKKKSKCDWYIIFPTGKNFCKSSKYLFLLVSTNI